MKTFSRAAVLSFAFAGALGSFGCATKSDFDSESHFLCESDSDCEHHGDRKWCVERLCVAVAHPKADLSAGGAVANDSGGSGGAVSDAGMPERSPGLGTAIGPTAIDAGILCSAPPSSACSACLGQTCGSAYSSCFADHACRQSLDEYALCLGSTCTSATTETCATNHLMPDLKNCLGACGVECAGTALATSCDLYCGCMPICDTVEYRSADPQTPILLGQACLTACAQHSTTPGLVECWRSHCEFGSGRLLHCEHATGADPVCADAVAK